ncbi:integrin alpha-PS1-like isoform X1 [Dermacentor variabilis]|uniref:integrin alpha-PS1-like isoform X1 n=2 Tax=Dermacentor variabilis TaxID=34621 RepID=UPI003F5C70D4
MYLLITVAGLLASVRAFNLEPRLPLLKQGTKGSYFGYSVSEHQTVENGVTIESLMLVGAPRAQTSQPGTNRSGAVYTCPMTTRYDDCTQLPVDNDTNAPDKEVLKDDQWLGVTVHSQRPGGSVLACAHRYVNKGDSYRWGRGICYTLSQFLDLHRAWEPCENRPVDKAHEQFGFCQAGTSGVISEDSTIVLGAPGPYTWKGTVFTITVQRTLRDWAWSVSPFLDEEAPVEKYSYLGMSVTSGKFFKNSMQYVAGAPRSNGTGKVVFFGKEKGLSNLRTLLILNGEQFASSFGYSLTSLDLNKDGLIDLVVGAPFYHGKGEGGAIYIYLNSKKGISRDTKPIKLIGKDESRFGFALSSAGDINRDGYPDLAVGAPYESGGGAIYIYLGSADGIVKEPSQVIRPQDLPNEIKERVSTLGYSLYGGMDLDSNGYPDLLSGNYETDSIVLFRARPIIDISTRVKGKLQNIDPAVQGCPDDLDSRYVCFSFEACFQFLHSTMPKLRNGTEAALLLNYRIEAETFTGKKYYRVRFNASANSEHPNIVERELEVPWYAAGREHCSRELVYLKDKSDIQSAIKMKLSYSLVQRVPRLPIPGASLPDIDRFPILNQKEASRVFEARFLKNCGSNDICESDLHVQAKLLLPTEEGVPVLFLGEEHVNMSVEVHNRGEPAYDAALYIYHSPALSYVGRKVVSTGLDVVDCVPHATHVKCELGNPLNQGKMEILLRFNTRSEADAETSLKFSIKANTTSQELSPEEDLAIHVNVVRVAELELRGATQPEQVWYGGAVVGAHAMKHFDEIGSKITHTYQVFNHGPWAVPSLDVVVSWPFEAENQQQHGKYLLYMTQVPQVAGDGECFMEESQVNPLGLKDRPSAITAASRTKKREKREIVISPEEVRLEGKTVRLVTMNCHRGSAKCFKFRCSVRNLKKQSSATVTISARLWNATLVEDYATVDQVSIFSSAEIVLDSSLEIRQKEEDDYAEAETRAYPDASLYQKTEGVALWIIILAIVAGILLLLLVIFILYKLGFFKRKRPADGYSPAPTSDKDFNGT